MQTNHEFLAALGIRPEDGFAAVEMRRVVAEMHHKPVLEMQSDTVGEPVSNFSLPWNALDFVYRLEKRLGVTIPRPENVGEIPEDWRAGPAVRMPLNEWMKIALRYFIEPIRAEIKPPENWTPLEPEGPLWEDKPIPFWWNLWVFLLLLYFFFIPVTLCIAHGLVVFLSMIGVCEKDWADAASNVSHIAVLVCWVVPLVLFLIYCFLFGLMRSISGKREIPWTGWDFPQLLGTLTFRESTLEFSDDETGQGDLEIVPGDYRFFLVYDTKDADRPTYAVLTTSAEPPKLDELLDLSFDVIEDRLSDDVQTIELAIDSCVIGLYEPPYETDDDCGADWMPGPSRKVVEFIRQRDGIVNGLKLYPTYGDGGYHVLVRRRPDGCVIILELVGPDEDEGRPAE